MSDTQNYHIKMPEAGYLALQQIAKSEKRLFADVIREALEQYTRQKGYNISFEVKRGGYRDRAAKTDPDA